MINILDLKIEKGSWQWDGTSLNIIAKILWDKTEVAYIVKDPHYSSFYGMLNIDPNIFSNDFIKTRIVQHNKEYSKEAEAEQMELFVCELKLKISELNALLSNNTFPAYTTKIRAQIFKGAITSH